MVEDKKFIIFSPSYDEKIGGFVVLHKLCHVLNSLGYEAYLFQSFENVELNRRNFLSPFLFFLKDLLRSFVKGYRVNESFNSPILKDLSNVDLSKFIVVYPEIVFGNPLRAPNVVRWLLHQPGYHNGKVYYGKNELFFKFNSAINDFCFPDSTTAKSELKVIHYPLDLYNMDGAQSERHGTAYCIRKGRGKKFVHETENSILIDGLSHQEVSMIFKRVKRFVSYDTHTAYSIFAVLCGAESVVIPDDGVSIEQWYPDDIDRNGIAYGLSESELVRANNTKLFVAQHVVREEDKNLERVESFVRESFSFFSSNKSNN